MTTDSPAVDVRWMEACGVSKRYRQPLLEKLAGREQIAPYCDELKEHCDEGTGLLLIGGIHSGKTMGLAYIVLRARQELPGSSTVVMATAEHLFDRLCQSPKNLDALAKVALLLIDDLGCQYHPDWGFERFEVLVEARYAEGRATCVATKLSAAELEDSLIMARIMSRWREVMELVLLPEGEQPYSRAERRAEMREAGLL